MKQSFRVNKSQVFKNRGSTDFLLGICSQPNRPQQHLGKAGRVEILHSIRPVGENTSQYRRWAGTSQYRRWAGTLQYSSWAGISSTEGGQVLHSTGGGQVLLSTGGGQVLLSTGGGLVLISTGGGQVLRSTGGHYIHCSSNTGGGLCHVQTSAVLNDKTDCLYFICHGWRHFQSENSRSHFQR